MTDFNIDPYYDDYDEAKKFHRILFRPGFAVQGRELTQMQTILQDQIKRHGNFTFKQGSMVVPGQSGIDLDFSFVKLQPQFSAVNIDVQDFLDQVVVGETSGATALVTQVVAPESSDPNTLYVKYLTGSSVITFTGDILTASSTITNISASDISNITIGGVVTSASLPADTYVVSVGSTQVTISNSATGTQVADTVTNTTSGVFQDDETISVIGTSTQAQSEISSASGVGSSAFIDEGIYYINGFFVKVEAQRILLDKYTNTPTYSIGLDFVETFTTTIMDSSLADPAQGSPNENAPGADRYTIDLTLKRVAVGSTVDEEFIELIRTKLGNIESRVDSTSLGSLGDLLAQRTFDESGSYTVRYFPIDVREHLDDGTNRGIYTGGNGGDASKLAIGLEPGRAYINGYLTKTLSTKFVDVDKGRDTAISNNVLIRTDIGNYVDVDNVTGTFGITNYETVNIIDGVSAIVGTAKVRSMRYESGTIGTTGAIYRIWMFDLSMNVGKSFAIDAKKIEATVLDGDTTIVLVGGTAILNETNKNIGLFKNPQDVVETYDLGSGVDTTYSVKRSFTGTMSEAGGDAITFSLGANEIFESFSNQDYYFTIRTASATATGNAFADGDIVALSGGDIVLAGAPTGRQVTITRADISGSVIDFIGPVRKTVSGEKTKTLQLAELETITAASSMSLNKPDIYALTSVTNVGGTIDYTDRFTLDNGQRDSFYDVGRVQLNAGSTLPSGDLEITYDYFDHSSGDYFSVDSYTGAIDYTDITRYTTSAGDSFELRDVLDFRPRVVDGGGSFVAGTEIVIPNRDVTADFSYYLPRKDKIFATRDGLFGVKRGISSLIPVAPSDPNDGMVIYIVDVPAYTFAITDVEKQLIDNKRYTMHEIGDIEKRIENLEYYTSLNLLEQDASNLFISDINGDNRFKSGFLVDNFTGHRVGDVENFDYKCSIDPANGLMRPQFYQENSSLEFNLGTSNDVTKTTDLVTLPYTTTALITQPLASRSQNINPYQVSNWAGTIELDPPSDDWMDTVNQPDIIINQQGNFNQILAQAQQANILGTEWGNWARSWTGRAQSDPGGGLMRRWGQRRVGIRTAVVPLIIRETIDTRVVSLTTIPFIRSRTINFNASRMKPKTQVWPFFDGVSVSGFVAPTGGSLGGDLFTDANGSLIGTFLIPNQDTLRFRTGSRQFRLVDEVANDALNSNTSAEGTYTAAGTLETRQDTVLSTRNGTVDTSQVVENIVRATHWDPLAQTFLVEEEGGLFISDLDIFFKQKDDTGLPVTLQIRTTDNGTPTQNVVAFGEVTLNPIDVNESADASVATKFTFADLVYLQDGVEYSFVLLTNSNKYLAYTARIAERDVVTNQLISDQPYTGSMFKSQNGSTWTPVQEEDIKFTINKCVFDIAQTSQALFDNVSIPTVDLIPNALETVDTTAVITVTHVNHNFVGANSKVTIAGATTTNGIPDTEINALHTVTVVNEDLYTITVTTNATSTGNGGGTSIISSTNYGLDVLSLLSQEMILPSTEITWEILTTDTGYVLDSVFTPIIANETTLFEEEHIIASQDNETANMAGSKSFKLRGTLTSTKTNISPVIDSKRLSIIAINNRINNLSTNEDGANGGDSIARYITQPVSLEASAIALNVYFSAIKFPESAIKVFYKVRREDDNVTQFSDIDYVEMTLETDPGSSVTPNDAGDYKFTTPDVDAFDIFAVKIVMTTTNNARVPEIADFRAIALGT